VSRRPGRGHDGGVSRNLGISAAPVAVRSSPTGWRDPRLWVGILIVAVSVVAGARVLAAADDSVSVWAVAADMGAGDSVGTDDLVARRVRFTDATDLARYFGSGETMPADLQLVRGVGAGELLPRTSVGAAASTGLLQVPLAVDAAQVPPGVVAGSTIDIYLVPSAGGECSPACSGQPVLTSVTVVDASSVDEGFGSSGRRQLVLGVAEDDVAKFFKVLGGSDTPTITVVRRS
jgi:hypothetical protein